jgi:uncharacterized SAM-binding protein YcdF (DUF218 family)
LLAYFADFPFKQLATPLVFIWFMLLLLVLVSHYRRHELFKLQLIIWLAFSASSCKPVVDQLALPLEQPFHAFNHPNLKTQVQHIMVLGCNHNNQTELPLTSQLAPCSLARITEGIRLWRQQPSALLHFSGHLKTTQQPHTEIARQFAIAMGVSPDRIRLHAKPSNTREEVQTLIQAIGTDPAVVVTSAMHLTRAMNWFDYYGRPSQSDLYAAPTDHSTASRSSSPYRFHQWLPSLSALEAMYYLQYEYMALLQQRWLMTDIAKPPAVPTSVADQP